MRKRQRKGQDLKLVKGRVSLPAYQDLCALGESYADEDGKAPSTSMLLERIFKDYRRMLEQEQP